jgi:hypothetical protein
MIQLIITTKSDRVLEVVQTISPLCRVMSCESKGDLFASPDDQFKTEIMIKVNDLEKAIQLGLCIASLKISYKIVNEY